MKIICGDRTLEMGIRTHVMGILNVTPDSFSDGGKFGDSDRAVAHAFSLLEDGADVIDIGGESTRPFANPVPVQDEIARVLPIVKALVARGVRNLSIDTRNSETARICLAEGASWINDISALTHDAKMLDAVQNADCTILMHTRAAPDKMQAGEIVYDNVTKDVRYYLQRRTSALVDGGFKGAIVVDPGIGFGKTVQHNLRLIRDLSQFQGIGSGVLCGHSRKWFIGQLTGIETPSERDAATIAFSAIASQNGADILRVHNVKQTVKMLKLIRGSRENLHQTG